MEIYIYLFVYLENMYVSLTEIRKAVFVTKHNLNVNFNISDDCLTHIHSMTK
jgi:hypothetical protein